MSPSNFLQGTKQGDDFRKKQSPDEKPLSKEDILKQYREEAQTFLDGHRYLFLDFAKSNDVKFILGDAFFINLGTKIVNLDTKWFYQKGFTKTQILWAVLHELTHFRDLVEDEKGVMANFEHCWTQAEQTAEWYIDRYRQTFPDRPDLLEKLNKPVPKGKKKSEGFVSAAQAAMYGTHHTFWNIFDDIFVNTEVPRRAAMYESGSKGGTEVRDLYATKLFATSDYTKLPRHLQFVYKLIREVMVPDEDVQVTEQIEDLLQTPLMLMGKPYLPMDIVRNCIIPHRNKDTKAGTRALVLRSSLEKMFMNLLKQDIDEWVPELPQEQPEQTGENNNENGEGEGQQGGDGEPQEGSGGSGMPQFPQESGRGSGAEDESDGDQTSNDDDSDPSEGGDNSNDENNPADGQGKPSDQKPQGADDPDNKEQQGSGSEDDTDDGDKNNSFGFQNPWQHEMERFEANSPDQLSEDDMAELRDKINKEIEERKEKEAKEQKHFQKSDTQKATEARQAAEEAFLKQFGITETHHQLYKDTLKEVAPYVENLSQLWNFLIAQGGKDIRKRVRHGVPQGTLDIPSVIVEFPNILRKQLENLRIMKQEHKEVLSAKKPEEIRLRFVGDLSGSMDDDGKRAMLRKAAVLLLASLANFEQKLIWTRGSTHSKLHINTEGWVYGRGPRCIKQLNKTQMNATKAAIIQLIAAMDADMGSTANHLVYEQILQHMDSRDEKRIRDGKLIDIVIEITDGAPDKEPLAKKYTEELRQKGLIVKAFQVGKVSESEKESFKSVWGEGPDAHGMLIGEDLSLLFPVLTELLKQYLGSISI